MQTKEKITAFKHEGLLNMIQLENGVHASLFLMGAAAFWFGCSNVAREIVSERAIYLRERRSGLSWCLFGFHFHVSVCAGGGSDLAHYHHHVVDGESDCQLLPFGVYCSSSQGVGFPLVYWSPPLPKQR